MPIRTHLGDNGRPVIAGARRLIGRGRRGVVELVTTLRYRSATQGISLPCDIDIPRGIDSDGARYGALRIPEEGTVQNASPRRIELDQEHGCWATGTS